MIRYGWDLLGEQPSEIVLGQIGRPWKAAGATAGPVAAPAAFATYDKPGYAKLALSLRVDPRGTTSSVLTMETRVASTMPQACGASGATGWSSARSAASSAEWLCGYSTPTFASPTRRARPEQVFGRPAPNPHKSFGSGRSGSGPGSLVTPCDGRLQLVLASMWPSTWTVVPRRPGSQPQRRAVEEEHCR